MAESEKKEAQAPKAPEPQDAEEAAKAAGREPQVAEKADASGDPKKIEEAARAEDLPTPDPGTPKEPAAAANPTEVLGPSDSGPNQMSTAGLNAIQRARVEGTPIDGAGGIQFADEPLERAPVGAARRAELAEAGSAEAAGKKRAASRKSSGSSSRSRSKSS